MGMSTHVFGFRPPDENWKKMKKIYDACVEAEVRIPEEVDGFFKGEPPNEIGVEVNIDKSLEDYHGNMREGFVVHLDKVPKYVKQIVFFNSW